MAGTKISELPAATLPLTGAELVPVVQGGATKQTTLSSSPYVPAGTGAVTRTVQSKLSDTVSVKDFGAVGDGVTDDTAAIQAAINKQNVSGGRVFFPAGTYKMNSHVTVSGGIFNIYGEGRTSVLTGPGRINSTTAADTSNPTSAYIGPMSGSAFYCTTTQDQTRIEALSFQNFKFAISFLTAHNSPAFVNCEYRFCNAFVFCYQGSQNYYYSGINGVQSGPVHISSATCFASDSPYKNSDNYYTDGFTFENASGALRPTGVENTFFDAWFQDSILRPAVGSYSVGTSNYVYPYASTDPVCKPSGWSLAYVPMRNPRGLIGLTIRDIDLRFGQTFGAACFNGAIMFGEIDGYNMENQTGVFPSHFTIGSVQSLTVSSVNTTVSGQPQKPFIRFTGSGYSSGTFERDNNRVVYINSVVTAPIYQPNYADTPTVLTFFNSIGPQTSYLHSTLAGYHDGSGQIDSRADAGRNNAFRPNSVGNQLKNGVQSGSWNFNSVYPFFNGTYWHRFDTLQTTSYGDYTGLFQISAVNLTTGETDYGEFYVQMGQSYTLTTAADINNGDYTITVTANPPRLFSRFTQFTVSGITVVAKSYDSATKVITLEGPVAGLTATVAVGATLSKTYFLVAVKNFARGFVQLSFAGFPFTNSYDLCLGSLVSSYSAALTSSDQSVQVCGTFTQTRAPNKTLDTAAPTTGKWIRGAIIWNSTPALGAPPGWVCVASGTPGTWKAMANLV
jgi:hypothetical protein